MKKRTMLLIVAFCFSLAAASFAADANVGAWKLNASKSNVPAGAARNDTVVYTAAGDSYKCVVDGVDAAGEPAHNEWTGKFDGKDYPVKGSYGYDQVSLKRVNNNSFEETDKLNGKVNEVDTWTVSKDGKNLTVVAVEKPSERTNTYVATKVSEKK